MTAVELDEIDKKLLQLAQDAFPITRRPWAKLGDKLKIAEGEVLSRLKRLRNEGVLRKIGPVIDSRKLDLNASTLIAMRVPEDRIEHVANIINKYKNVTHNYLRQHEYNLWFTITTSSKEELRKIMKEIRQRTKISDDDILDLPTIRRFKIDVRFQFT
ncbi:MAG: AsnC family transcriptional regulator [Candidatus Thorarchaeota archaeon]|nr:AsnC family transcriptional regulator [Candidatus Thorarchaeota archaeon]